MDTQMSKSQLKSSRHWLLLFAPIAIVVMVGFGKLVDTYDLPSWTTIAVVFAVLAAALFTAIQLGRKSES